MALSTKSLHGKVETDPIIERAQLEEQRAALDAQFAANEAPVILARRRVLAELLKSTVLTDDGSGRQKEHDVKAAEKALESARQAFHQHNANRTALAIRLQAERSPIVAELFATSPPRIEGEMQQIQSRVRDANSARRNQMEGDFYRGQTFYSNDGEIDRFVGAAEIALRELAALKLEAIGEDDLQKRIAKILKTLGRDPDTKLVCVKSTAPPQSAPLRKIL